MISGFSTDGKSNPLQIKQKISRAAESRCSRRIFTRRALSIIKSIVLFGSCLILFHNHNVVHGAPNTKSLTRIVPMTSLTVPGEREAGDDTKTREEDEAAEQQDQFSPAGKMLRFLFVPSELP